MAGRPPDYRIKALNKNTDETDYIGAAWINDDDPSTISLRFNPFVTVPTGKDFVISLFPNVKQQDRGTSQTDQKPHHYTARQDVIPF